jgi:magnesium transporter
VPIVAGTGRHGVNQITTMIARAITMGQLEPSAWRRLMVKPQLSS